MVRTSRFASVIPQALILTAALALGTALRVIDLDRRPMHHDEANQAVRTGLLLQSGGYRYDPHDHHGPSLYYLSLPLVWMKAGRDFAKTDEVTFRLIPALFGIGLILLPWLVRDGLGKGGAACAAVITAVSPGLVYYSRFYVHETLLVFFSFGAIAAGWRYLRRPSAWRATLVGAFLGMMYATKETSVIAFAALAGALALTAVLSREKVFSRPFVPSYAHVLACVGAAAAVVGLLFSSFLSNPAGLWDSVRSFSAYAARGKGDSLHVHPWYFYLQLLAFARDGRGPIFTEIWIIGAALFGGLFAWVGLRGVSRAQPAGNAASLNQVDSRELRGERLAESAAWTGDARLVRFLALYTLLLAAAYSAIPHKTPWCMLSFLHAFVLLAGFGCARLIRLLARPWARALSLVVLIGCGAHLLWTCRLASFRYDADPRNPYVYAQTSRDLLNLVKRVEQISALDPRGEGMLVEVVAHPYETWPLPWYFRKLTSVGYWATAAEAPVAPKASVVIASEAEGEALARRLEGEYQVEFYGLRPSVLLLAYVRNDLWEEFLKRSGAAKRTGP